MSGTSFGLEIRLKFGVNTDGRTILVAKVVRTVPYGFLGVLFGVYLDQLGFSAFAVGLVLAATILSSAFYTFVVSFFADRLGRRRTLVFFALTDFVAGGLLLLSTSWWAPVLAGIVGNMTVGAGEVGPFLSLDQAILPRTCEPERRTFAFSIYNLVGYGASSVGALLAAVPQFFGSTVAAFRPLFLIYLFSGLFGAFLYSTLSRHVEVDRINGDRKAAVLSNEAKPIVLKLSGLFAIDAFGGGFIGQSILAYFFFIRFGLSLSGLGTIFFATQIVTSISFLLAPHIARRVGLLRTMVFTHIPSNIFLTAVAFAPTPLAAVILLLCRQSTSQMDVPARQAYVMAMVNESDRTAAAGLTNTTRTVFSSISPSLAGYAISNFWVAAPLVAAGTLKLAYDFMIYAIFRNAKPPEEIQRGRA